MKCAQQHTTDRHTRHTRGTHWHTLANTCTHTTHCRLPSPGTPNVAHQRKKHSVLILIEKLLIFHASSSRGSNRDGSSRGRPRPLLTPTHTHTYTQSCLLTHLHIPTHTHAHTCNGLSSSTFAKWTFCAANFAAVCVLRVCICVCVWEYAYVCVLVLLVPCSVSG